MLDQLFGPCYPGPDLVGFELDKIHVVTFLASRKQVVVHLSQRLGNLVRLYEMMIEEAAHPGR